MALPFDDNFDRADSPTVGNSWTERVDAKWELLGNRLRYLGGGDYRDVQCLRPASENIYNGTISVEFNRSATDQAPYVQGRYSTNYFYQAWVYNQVLYLSKVINRTKTDLGSVTGLSIPAGTWYKLTLTMNGTSLTAQLHRVSDSALIGELTRTDSALTSAGQHGVSGGAASTAFDLDNYHAEALVDVKTITDTAAGADDVVKTDAEGLKNVSDSASGDESLSIGVVGSVADTASGADSVSIVATLAISDVGAGADDAVLYEPPMLALNERFDGTLAAWTLDTSGGTASIQTVNNDEKLILNDTSGSAIVSATRAIDPQTAPFCIEADAYTAAGAIGCLEALDSGDNVVFSIKFDSGAALATFDTDNDTASTFAWAAAGYVQVVIYADTAAKTARAFYTTGAGATPSKWNAVSAAKSYSGAAVSKVRLATDAAATGEVRFDEVRVFRPSVFCIGDSNTAGYKSSSPYWSPVPSAAQRTGSGEDEEHSWPHWLGLKYAPAEWSANRGINSDTSADFDDRVQADCIDQGARTVAMLIGTNDITAGTALATIEANIQSAAGKAASAGCTVCLCSVPPRNAWTSAQNTKRSDLNAWIQSHASASGYKFADVYAAVKNPSNPDQLDPAYDAGDGTHFLTAGLQKIADTVYGALLETKAVAESAAGADSVSVLNSLALAESGAGADSLSVAAQAGLADSGIGDEAISIFVSLALNDSGLGQDSTVAGGLTEPQSVGDTGAGLDEVSTVVKEGASLQNIYDLVATRLASASYTAPDNAGVAAVKADSTQLLSFIRNRKEVRKVGSAWYLVVYDDLGGPGEILRKALKDKDGNAITDLAAGTLAQELASSV